MAWNVIMSNHQHNMIGVFHHWNWNACCCASKNIHSDIERLVGKCRVSPCPVMMALILWGCAHHMFAVHASFGNNSWIVNLELSIFSAYADLWAWSTSPSTVLSTVSPFSNETEDIFLLHHNRLGNWHILCSSDSILICKACRFNVQW